MNSQNTSKSLSYGVGALIILVVSAGVAAVVYGLALLAFDWLSSLAWVFGPLGVYTLAYALIAKRDSTFYLIWGSVMFAIALVSAFYTVVNPLVIVGVLAIAIAVIGIVAYQRSKK